MYQEDFWKMMREARERGRQAYTNKKSRTVTDDATFCAKIPADTCSALRWKLYTNWEKGYDLAQSLELCVY